MNDTMKQLTIEIKEDKYEFFLELVKNLGFVRIVNEKNLSEKNKLVQNIARGMQEAKLASKGKMKSYSVKGSI